MTEQIENKMVVDQAWDSEKCHEVEEKLNGPGWLEMGTGVFVPEEDAYGYALERISLDEELKQEFVEWFYSGNWIEEDGSGSD